MFHQHRECLIQRHGTPRRPGSGEPPITERGAEATLDALSLGASDYCTKPTSTSLEASLAVVRDGPRITLTVTADGFLRSMVRRIAGSLIEIGRGKLPAGALFAEARWTAPAKGLVLVEVRY